MIPMPLENFGSNLKKSLTKFGDWIIFVSMKKLNLFRYIGGKSHIAKYIIQLFPEHKTYVEVFGGAGSVLLQKPPSKVEIFNDYDEDIYTVWKVMKEHGDEVAKRLEEFIYHEKLYYKIRNEWKSGYKGEDEIDKTVRFLFLQNVGFSGLYRKSMAPFGYTFENNRAKQFYNKIETYYLIKERLKNVQILCRDFREIIEMAEKREGVLMYLDPPYYSTEHYYRGNKFTIEDHKDLAELLNKTKTKFVLSYYDYPFLQEFYPPDKFNYYKIKTSKFSWYVEGGKERPKAEEILITNYRR